MTQTKTTANRWLAWLVIQNAVLVKPKIFLAKLTKSLNHKDGTRVVRKQKLQLSKWALSKAKNILGKIKNTKKSPNHKELQL